MSYQVSAVWLRRTPEPLELPPAYLPSCPPTCKPTCCVQNELLTLPDLTL